MIHLFQKIPLFITPQFWVFSALFGFAFSGSILGTLSWVFVVLVSVLTHELGHALFSLMWGQKVRIELGAFGGVTVVEKGEKLSSFKEFMVILMGPLFGLLLALVSFFFFSLLQSSTWHYLENLFSIFAIFNLFWSIINLLPVYPLDGGRIMGVVFESIFGFSGLRASYLVSIPFGLLLGILFLVVSQPFVGILFLLFSYDSYRIYKQSAHMVPVKEAQKINDDIDEACSLWLSSKPQEAISLLEEVCKNKKGAGYMEALVRLCHYLLATKQAKKAYHYLEPEKAKLDIDGLCLLQLAAYHTQNYKEAQEVGEQISAEGMQTGDSYLINAFAAAALHQEKEAINWLIALSQDPEVSMKEVLLMPEFDHIRQNENFRQLQKQFS